METVLQQRFHQTDRATPRCPSGEFARSASRRFKTAIVSSNRVSVEHVAERLGIIPLDDMHTSEAVSVPSQIRNAFTWRSAFWVDCTECLVFEDSIAGLTLEPRACERWRLVIITPIELPTW